MVLKKKLILTFFIIFLFSIALVSSSTLDKNTKEYNSITKEVTIKNSTSSLLSIKLIENSDRCGAYCYSIFEINNSKDIKLQSEYNANFSLRFLDKNNSILDLKNTQLKIYKGLEDVYGHDDKNKSIKIGTKELWGDWNWKGNNLSKGITRIKLEAYRDGLNLKNIDWQLQIANAGFITEWAWWTVANMTYYYKLNEGTGTTLYDSTGNYNTSISGDNAWIQGFSSAGGNYAINCSGNCSVDTGYQFTSGTNQPHSVSMWINAPPYPIGKHALWTSGFNWASGGGNGYELEAIGTDSLVLNGTDSFTACNWTGIRDGKWHFIAWVINTSTVTCYSNNTNFENSSTSGLNSGTPLRTSRFFASWFGTNIVYNYTGALDDVTLWKVQLNYSDINQKYLEGLSVIPTIVSNTTTPTTPIYNAQFNWTIHLNDSDHDTIIQTNFSVNSPNGTLYTYTDSGIENGNSWDKNFSISNITINLATAHLGNWSLNATTTTNNPYNSEIVYTYYQFGVYDIIKPSIVITSPINNSVDRNRPTQFNLSIIEDVELSSCWYNLNQTATNVTISCTNFTLSLTGGNNYNMTIWVNDTSNNVNSTYVNFTVYNDITSPNVTITAPTGTLTSRTVTATFNVSDDNVIQYCFYNVTTSAFLPIISNTQITNCQTNTTVTFDTGADYSNAIFNIWANDTYGNQNNASSTFTVNTAVTPPSGGGGGGSSVTYECNFSAGTEILSAVGTKTLSPNLNPNEQRLDQFLLILNGEAESLKVNSVQIISEDLSGTWFTIKEFPKTVPAEEKIMYDIIVPEGIAKGSYKTTIRTSLTSSSCTKDVDYIINIEVSDLLGDLKRNFNKVFTEGSYLIWFILIFIVSMTSIYFFSYKKYKNWLTSTILAIIGTTLLLLLYVLLGVK